MGVALLTTLAGYSSGLLVLDSNYSHCLRGNVSPLP
jgi:hypothetical protein